MNVKLEDQTTETRIKNLRDKAERVLDIVPAEHLRGLTKLVFVDLVNEPRLSAAQRSTLPALYHPKMPGQMAWAEIATAVLAPKRKFPQNLLGRLALKSNLAQVLLSLVAQHYYLTLSKGIKKNQLEIECRKYVEKYFEKWRNQEGGLRVKLLKPFKPQLDRMAKRLAKRYREEASKQQATRKPS
jgi:hypothetical protein